jgi:hypothetical protein
MLYMTNGPIKLDVKLVRSVESICLNLNRPRTLNEITAACMGQPREDEFEPVNLFDPYYLYFFIYCF